MADENHPPAQPAPTLAGGGIVAFYGNQVLVVGRCGRFVIPNAVFSFFARTLPGITANQLCAWLWGLRAEMIGLNYSVLIGAN